MTNLREQIADEFDNCMGYHEGIYVPTHNPKQSAIAYADRVLKLFEKRIDNFTKEWSKGWQGGIDPYIRDIMDDFKKEILK